jgi:hypothetical protein
MTVVIFGIGVLVFFLTVYGTVIGGGLKLTKQQLKSSPELAAKAAAGADNPEGDVPTQDVIRAEF